MKTLKGLPRAMARAGPRLRVAARGFSAGPMLSLAVGWI